MLLCGIFWAGADARAQAPPASKAGQPPAQGQGQKPDAASAAKPDPNAQAPAQAKTQEPRREPSPAYRESIRKTLEQRRQRRARRALQGLNDGYRPIGAIVPWPMPPALIIRHTPEVHGEVESLFGGLRR